MTAAADLKRRQDLETENGTALAALKRGPHIVHVWIGDERVIAFRITPCALCGGCGHVEREGYTKSGRTWMLCDHGGNRPLWEVSDELTVNPLTGEPFPDDHPAGACFECSGQPTPTLMQERQDDAPYATAPETHGLRRGR